MTNIELVIKIDDETYKNIIENGFIYAEDIEYVTQSIKKSTQLPKGHGELIDRNNLLKEQYCIEDEWSGNKINIVEVMKIKIADAIVEEDEVFKCEHCSKKKGSLGCCSTVNNNWVYSCAEGQKEWLLDKIRAEIKHKSEHFINEDGEDSLGLYEDDVFEIINKYI
jgi:hypothetical protein